MHSSLILNILLSLLRSFHNLVTANVDVSNNRLTQNMPSSVCMLSVYEEGETVEFRADCDVCNCGRLCYRSCQRGAKDYHNY